MEQKETNEFNLSKEPQWVINGFKRSKYYNKNLKGNELKEAFEKWKKEPAFKKTKPKTLKELVEQAKERDKPKVDPDKKVVYSFRLTKKIMDKFEHYIEKERLNKTAFMEHLINDFLKDGIFKRQVFSHTVKVKLKDKNTCYIVNLNNKLDHWIDGSYRADKHYHDSHEGLEIIHDPYLNITYYIQLFFDIDCNKYPYFTNIDYEVISYDEAMELAIEKENDELREELLLKTPEPKIILKNKVVSKNYIDRENIEDGTINGSKDLENKIEELQSELEKEKEDKKKLERNMKILFEDLEKMHLRDKEISKKLNKIDIKKLEELLDELQT